MEVRKRTRLQEYDYSAPGAYFITICTKDKKCILSHIVGDGVLDVPQNVLTDYGKTADLHINRMNNFYDYISVDKYVIMPNHIHLLLSIKSTQAFSKYGTSGTPSPTNSVIAKFVSSFKRFCNKEYGKNIWQRSFHDHIIRGTEDYKKIWQYIDTNTIKWKQDCFYNEEKPQ